MTESELERLIDVAVMARLSIDQAYNNAEDAESQSAREEEITSEVERRLIAKHGQPT